MKLFFSRGLQMTKRKKDALAIQWVFIPFHCTFSTYFWQLGQTRRRTFRWCGTPCGVWAGAGSTRPHRGDRHIFYETKFLLKINTSLWNSNLFHEAKTFETFFSMQWSEAVHPAHAGPPPHPHHCLGDQEHVLHAEHIKHDVHFEHCSFWTCFVNILIILIIWKVHFWAGWIMFLHI